MKTKQFFNKIKNSSAFWMILSLLISLVIWTYLESKDIKQTEKIFQGVPVRITGVADDMMIIEQSNGTVDFTISGPSRLVNQLSMENLSANIDASGLSAQEYNKRCTVVLPDTLNEEEKAELHVSFSVNNVSTENSVTFRLSKIKTVSVKIEGAFAGTLNDHCNVEDIRFEPERIDLTGPEYYLDNVSKVLITFGENDIIDRTYSEDSYSRSFAVSSDVVPESGGYVLVMKTAGNEDYNNSSDLISYAADLDLSMKVYRTEKFTVKVDDSEIKYNAGATPENTSFALLPSSIELSGIPSVIESAEKTLYLVPKIDTRNIVDLDDSKESFYTKRTLKLTIPEGLSTRGESNEISLTVTIKDLITKEFKVTKFTVVNPPDGYETKVKTTSITVTLRGPADIINSMTADQIVAEVDLKGKAPDSNPIYTPEIKIDGLDDKVGTIGKIDPISINFEIAEEE